MARNEHPQRMPGRVIAKSSRAGVIGAAIMIGLALYLFFRGFGPGGTGASGSGTSGDSDGNTMITVKGAPEAAEEAFTAPDPVQGGLTADEKKSLSGEVLNLLIDEKRYLMEIPDDQGSVFREVPLSRAVQLAEIAEGDNNGIKVRILRRESARASAEFDLIDALHKAGIRKDATIMPGEFVP